MSIRWAALLAVALALPLRTRAEEADADLSRAGCTVRTAAVDDQGISLVQAACTWQDVAPQAVLAVLRDPARLARALSTLAECRRLPDGRLVQVHRVGWPIDDRQITLDWSESALPGGGTRFDYHGSAAQEALVDGRVQIRIDEGSWEIRPGASGGTRLRYTSRYDAGGNLKPWVVRAFQTSGIATSLAELRAAAL
jgi:hypothetical protein